MKNIFKYSLIILLTTACSNKMDELADNTNQQNSSEVILQERDPNLPTEWTTKKPRTSTRAELPSELYIGRSYDVGNTIIGDVENVRLPVLRIDKIEEEEKVEHDFAGATAIMKFAYADYDRYEKNVSTMKTINTGFSLNLKVFKIGRTKKITETFNSNSVSTNERVYGQVDIEVRHKSHLISATSGSAKELAADYLHPNYLFDLYFCPMTEVVSKYGPFVVTGYYSGGRATALYYGSSNSEHGYEGKETDMQTDVNTSFAWGESKGDTTASVKLKYGFGTNKGNNETSDTKLTKSFIQIRTKGGAYNLQSETSAEEIKKTSINLEPWLNSLNDENNHTLIGIRDEGLTGLNQFMLEENFKRRMQDTHLGYLEVDAFMEPFIEIAKVYIRSTSSGEKLYDIVAVLNTRQGDKIILSDGNDAQASDAELRANSNSSTFQTKSQAIATEKSKYYKCAIRANGNTIITPQVRTPLSIKFKAIQENRMYKFTNENSDMYYIYDPVGLCAYAYYLDDYVLDMYGMRDWIDTVPSKSISMRNLFQRYTIIGL